MSSTRLRVIDLTDELSFQAARLFVGLGADVIRLERPGAPELTRSEQLHWHSGKRVVRPAGPGMLTPWSPGCSPGPTLFLESGAAPALRTPALRDAEPDGWRHVVHVLVTPFGRDRAHNWLADDTVVTASGGMAWLGGTPGEAPEPPPREQGLQLAGAHAAIGAYLALIARDRTGQGQLVEISAQESVAATLETGAIAWIHGGTVPGRTSGVYGHVAHRVFAAADGHLGGGYSGSPRMWDDLLAWMAEEGEAEDLTDEEWADAEYRWRGLPHVDEAVGRFMARRTVAEVAEEARRRALPWAEVAPPWRLIDNPQLAYRKFLVEVEAAEGTVTDVGFPYESAALRRPVRLAEPRTAGETSGGPTALPGPPRAPAANRRVRVAAPLTESGSSTSPGFSLARTSPRSSASTAPRSSRSSRRNGRTRPGSRPACGCARARHTTTAATSSTSTATSAASRSTCAPRRARNCCARWFPRSTSLSRTSAPVSWPGGT